MTVALYLTVGIVLVLTALLAPMPLPDDMPFEGVPVWFVGLFVFVMAVVMVCFWPLFLVAFGVRRVWGGK